MIELDEKTIRRIFATESTARRKLERARLEAFAKHRPRAERITDAERKADLEVLDLADAHAKALVDLEVLRFLASLPTPAAASKTTSRKPKLDALGLPVEPEPVPTTPSKTKSEPEPPKPRPETPADRMRRYQTENGS